MSPKLLVPCVLLPLVASACVFRDASEPTPTPPEDDPMVEAHAADAARRAAAGVEEDPGPFPGPGGAAPLAHLAGCWVSAGNDGDRWLVTYTRPTAGIVLGTTRHLRGERLITDEVERFVVEDDGTLIVTPIANGITRDSFAYVADQSEPGRAHFQRRGQGFPQTLSYAATEDGLEIVARDDSQALGMKLRPGPCF